MHQQQREEPEQFVPALEYLYKQAEDHKDQKKYKRFDAAGTCIGEHQHKQHERDKGDAYPRTRMKEHGTAFLDENHRLTLQPGQECAQESVAPDDPPIEEVGMLVDNKTLSVCRTCWRRRCRLLRIDGW